MGKPFTSTPLTDLLPGSISGDEAVQASARALDDQLAAVNALALRLILMAGIASLEEPLLSILAWQLHVDYWPDDFTVEQKREAVARSLIRHQRKGTPAFVEEAVAEVLGNAELTEWPQYDGDPYYFRVETTGDLGDAYTYQKKLLPAIEASKNARSWLDRLTVRRELNNPVDVRMAVAKSHRWLTIKVRLSLDMSIPPEAAIVPMIWTRTVIAVRE